MSGKSVVLDWFLYRLTNLHEMSNLVSFCANISNFGLNHLPFGVLWGIWTKMTYFKKDMNEALPFSIFAWKFIKFKLFWVDWMWCIFLYQFLYYLHNERSNTEYCYHVLPRMFYIAYQRHFSFVCFLSNHYRMYFCRQYEQFPVNPI